MSKVRTLHKGDIVKFDGQFVKVVGFTVDQESFRLCVQLEDKQGNVGHVPRIDVIWNGKQFIYAPVGANL
ncbi:MAG: hypothetical protein PWQ67_2593 [Clostridia bacterium]|nr:hypothetical protein [Clostridia bacterium]